ncbi:MAG: MerR family transcriptional regulator, light-induced transcriptional regulator [Solirubrobacteraceae bacterium]|jgi:hypothetical protein|nr:MerR family transcriptional regulator, light-induced transcriptional regulator [Solirubrobacteraceae bacterium]
MAKLTIGEAAAVLHTAPSTIRSWEQRLGYPHPTRTTSGRRLYDDGEIALLADALASGLGISSAIRQIRQETGAYAALLQHALSRLEVRDCDALLESAIAMSGVSRAFDDTVLAAVEGLAAEEHDPAVVSLAVEWVRDHTCWSRRQAALPMAQTVLVVDSSGDGSVTRAASCILQLQLVLRSTASRTLVGSSVDSYRAVARSLHADAIVFVGPLPPSAYRDHAIATSRITGFRIEAELRRHRIATLPPQPRDAADELLSHRADEASSGLGGTHANGRVDG